MPMDAIETIHDGDLRACSHCNGRHLVQTSLREFGTSSRQFVACGELGLILVGVDGYPKPERLLVSYC